MDALSELLKRIPIPGLKESNDRHRIAAILTESMGVQVSARQLSLKDGILHLSLPPVLKSALHIRKQGILARLSEEGIEVREIK